MQEGKAWPRRRVRRAPLGKACRRHRLSVPGEAWHRLQQVKLWCRSRSVRRATADVGHSMHQGKACRCQLAMLDASASAAVACCLQCSFSSNWPAHKPQYHS